MSLRNIAFPSKFKQGLRPLNSRINEILNTVRNYETPERLRGTFVERWGRYWKNLFLDYKDVAVDVVKDCKQRPVRATAYTLALGSCWYFYKHNPDECSFREQLLQSTLKMMQVGEPIRNPVSVQHINWLEKCYNEGVIRRLSLGVISFIWIDNYDKTCSLYKAVCPYLKPQYLTFHKRIVDIGFLDKWWILEDKMQNYDINEAEFSHLEPSKQNLSSIQS